MRTSRVWGGLGLVVMLTPPVSAQDTNGEGKAVTDARVRFSLADIQSLEAWTTRHTTLTGTVQPSEPPTTLRVRVRTTPDSAYRTIVRVLTERGYSVRDGLPHALSTSDHYVAGVGMVRVHVRVLPDSLGSVVHVSGEWRRLRRLLIVSAMSKDSVVIAAGAGGARGAQAWQELSAIGEELGGVVLDETDLHR